MSNILRNILAGISWTLSITGRPLTGRALVLSFVGLLGIYAAIIVMIVYTAQGHTLSVLP